MYDYIEGILIYCFCIGIGSSKHYLQIYMIIDTVNKSDHPSSWISIHNMPKRQCYGIRDRYAARIHITSITDKSHPLRHLHTTAL
jgi:hypothetical protein